MQKLVLTAECIEGYEFHRYYPCYYTRY